MGVTEQDLISSALERMVSKLELTSQKIVLAPSAWLEKHFWIPEPKDLVTAEPLPPGPIRLAEHQKRIIDEALARNEDGKFKYTNVIYSAPKKSGKSAISAAIALYMAYTTPFGNIFCVANDGKQSDDRLFGPISQCIKFHKQNNLLLSDTKVKASEAEAYLSNDSKIEAIPCDAAGEAGSEPTASFFCFDEETEILTRAGWKSFNQYDETDEFATLDSNGYIEYQKSVAICKQMYSGPMHLLQNHNYSLCVTPHHKLYGKFYSSSRQKYKREFIKLPVEQAKTFGFCGVRLETFGFTDRTDPCKTVTIEATERKPAFEIPLKRYLQLLGWYISEGCTHKNEAVMLAQSKKKNPEYYKELCQLVRDLGYEPYVWKNTNAIIIYDTRLVKHFKQFGLSCDKFIPQWVKELPQEYIEIFLEAYWKGDGYSEDIFRPGRRFCTNSKQLKDDLMEIGIRAGQYTSYTEYQDKRWGKPVYTVRFADYRSGEYFVGIKRKFWSTLEYSGIIHCPSVPNGIVCIRRKGKIQWQGQSEIWGYDTDKKRRLFTELTIPPTKFGRAIRWVESYAGYKGKSDILWGLYETAVLNGTPHPDFLDLTSNGEPVVWVNEAAQIFCYWDHEHRMAWQTPKYYQGEALIHSASEFERVHKNNWVSPVGAFIAPEWWDACQDDTLPQLIDDRVPVVVGIDASETNDCTAIVAVTRDPSRPETDVAIRACKIFKPIPGKSVVVLEDTVGEVIKEWGKKWNIVCIAYDAYQMAKLVQDYRRGHVTIHPSEIAGMDEVQIEQHMRQTQKAIQRWYYKFSQQSARAVADKQLYDMILNRQIHWNPNDLDSDIAPRGNDETLTKHVKQAGAKTDNEKYRIQKLSNDLKTDAVVALSMAVERCLTLILDNNETKDNIINVSGSNQTIRMKHDPSRKAMLERQEARIAARRGIRRS